MANERRYSAHDEDTALLQEHLRQGMVREYATAGATIIQEVARAAAPAAPAAVGGAKAV